VLTKKLYGGRVAVKEIKHSFTHDEQKLKELEEDWSREVKAHTDLNSVYDGGPHPNIIEFIAAIQIERKRCLMFRWADGGNLREFWRSHSKPVLSAQLVKEVIQQLRGLSDALNQLHDYQGIPGSSYRHGDIKPENILRIKSDSSGRQADDAHNVDIGTLKISDMGLAKHHTVATALRPPTNMRYSTYRYSPPEAAGKKGSSWSRRFDASNFRNLIISYPCSSWIYRTTTTC
jgi:serine/threonine protein kinase